MLTLKLAPRRLLREPQRACRGVAKDGEGKRVGREQGEKDKAQEAGMETCQIWELITIPGFEMTMGSFVVKVVFCLVPEWSSHVCRTL